MKSKLVILFICLSSQLFAQEAVLPIHTINVEQFTGFTKHYFGLGIGAFYEARWKKSILSLGANGIAELTIFGQAQSEQEVYILYKRILLQRDFIEIQAGTGIAYVHNSIQYQYVHSPCNCSADYMLIRKNSIGIPANLTVMFPLKRFQFGIITSANYNAINPYAALGVSIGYKINKSR